jgi:O-Antigen ligase
VQTRTDSSRRIPLSLAFAVGGMSLVAVLGMTRPDSMTRIGPALFLVAAFVGVQRLLLRWRSLIGLIVLMMLFVPMRRYSLPSSLPIQLEPYRLVVALVAFGWLTSLLIDKRVRVRRTGLERPLGLFVFSAIVSMGLNPGRVSSVSSLLAKTLMFWVSYFVIVYLLPSVLRRVDVDFVCKLLVGGGAVVAIAAIVESRTGYNVFNHLTSAIPFLRLGQIPLTTSDLTAATRGGRPRAYASAQHPIALGAAFAMLFPLAVYLARSTGQKRWWACALLTLLGLFATVSRTGFLMVVIVVMVITWLRFHELKRYWPALIPAVVMIHFAVPGTFGTMIQAFFPKGGLVAQQTNANVGSGRLATLKPVLRSEFYPNPIFGEGFGTRISGDNGPGVVSNAPILDDEWANVLVETGIVGTFALLWVLVRAVRMLARMSREDPGPGGWLPAALAASVAGFGIGMLTFDAFSFIQVTFLFFLVLGLIGVLHNAPSATRAETVRSGPRDLWPSPAHGVP